MTTAQDLSAITRALGEAIERRYAEPEWFCLPHVGMDGRQIDFVAFGLWRSRGNLILGFEIKGSRSDWLRELKNPSKAELTALACDEWWVVAPRGVVEPDEVPRGWGLLEKRGRGLRCVVKAQPRPAELCRQMMASFIRRCRVPTTRAAEEAYRSGYRVGQKNAKDGAEREARSDGYKDQAIGAWLVAFKQAAGFDLHAENATELGALLAATRKQRDIRAAVADYLTDARDCALRILDLVDCKPYTGRRGEIVHADEDGAGTEP